MGKQKTTPWDQRTKSRIMSSVARNPNSPSARDGLDRKAQSGADRNEYMERYQTDEEDEEGD